ncbi:MAG: galactose-1-phosphate uridylyltransferase [Candidatus Gastranaerophilales bacterium]|nr:galactose-1-phosphate uridylyltransferase [Candidatus Gastranaerophilales bacterium]
MPEFRKNIITEEWASIATERAKRPEAHIISGDEVLGIEHNSNCPFCYGNELLTPLEISSVRNNDSKPNTEGWQIRVVPNKFPAFDKNGKFDKNEKNTYAYGEAEVIIDSPHHCQPPSLFEIEQIELLLKAYKERYDFHKQNKKLNYVLIFRNNGKSAGASLPHPHSQLIATPVVPPTVKKEMNGAEKFFNENEKCVFCHLIEEEIKENKRIIAQNDDFIAFCPFASFYSFETWIIPKFHSANFEVITESQLKNFAKIYKITMFKLHKGFNNPPYNYYIHTSPLQENCDKFYHWHMEIIPKFTFPAGFELGTGIFINSSVPEDCAKFLNSIKN